ncbi:hypothetical protein SPHINGO391_350126 [Sphingomonas aurantiaca]|uniref:Uncharacterized protein n=1 Tax=Sphingomonas aurantiaca TaxID=185949 RepID=A0A5E7Y233_9SPHN|nr:hypothetical protein SPHINGO391_350126 [Sphingomonas aurantiaca]
MPCDRHQPDLGSRDQACPRMNLSAKEQGPEITAHRLLAIVAQRDFDTPSIGRIDHAVDKPQLVQMLDPALRRGHRRVGHADQCLDVHRLAFVARHEQREHHVPGRFVEQLGRQEPAPQPAFGKHGLRLFDQIGFAGFGTGRRRIGSMGDTAVEFFRNRRKLGGQVLDQIHYRLVLHQSLPLSVSNAKCGLRLPLTGSLAPPLCHLSGTAYLLPIPYLKICT